MNTPATTKSAEFTLPAPPAEFMALRAQYLAALESHRPERRAARCELEAMFARFFSLTPARINRPWRIFGSKADHWPHCGPFPCDDHARMWLCD